MSLDHLRILEQKIALLAKDLQTTQKEVSDVLLEMQSTIQAIAAALNTLTRTADYRLEQLEAQAQVITVPYTNREGVEL